MVQDFSLFSRYRLVVDPFLPKLHQIRASEHDLLALARFWRWEHTVRRRLPDVVADANLKMLFQPVFGLHGGVPLVRGYEALARFPVAVRIPPGLWFRVASEMGLSHDLELAAAQKAADAFPRSLLDDSLLFINASLTVAIDLVNQMPPQMTSRLIVDIPYMAMGDPGCKGVFDRVREEGAWVAIDDVPVRDLHTVRAMLVDLRPDFVKVDLITGLTDDPLAKLELTKAVIWCEGSGIVPLAERVEKVTDLQILYDLGVRFAQGYSLAMPVEAETDRIR